MCVVTELGACVCVGERGCVRVCRQGRGYVWWEVRARSYDDETMRSGWVYGHWA